MGFRDWFRRNTDDEGLDDTDFSGAAELRAAREAQVLKDVCDAIDVINANLPDLPRGVHPWMQWRPTPRLTLVARSTPDSEVLHGDGFHRLEF